MANIAAISLALEDGEELAARIDPRFISLRLTEKRGEEADELELTLQNHDGRLETPVPGKVLILRLGWRSHAEAPPGLVDKGRFTVDEVSESGPPDIVSIRARAADLTGEYRKRRTESWRDTTLGSILGRIADRNGGFARVESGLAATAITAIEQEGKSDMAFVRDLGRRYDAIATWKDGVLLFLPIGASATASGNPLPGMVLTKQDGWSWTFTRADREKFDGAEAQYHDQDEGRRKTVSTGGQNRRKLKRVYASEDDARQAAQASSKKAAREPFKFEYDLAVADPELQPDQPVTLRGWSPTIDAISWLVESVETTFDAGGLRQKLSLESGS